MAVTLTGKFDVMILKAPETAPFKEYWHTDRIGFGVRVMRQRSDGVIKRLFISRTVEPTKGGTREVKKVIGMIEPIAGDTTPVMTVQQALKLAGERFHAAKARKKQSTSRYTVGDAYERLEKDWEEGRAHDSPAYIDKLKAHYRLFLSPLEGKYLDTLDEKEWTDFYWNLRKAVNERPRALSAAYALGILNAASRLYTIAHENGGLPGRDRGWDPTRAAVKKMEPLNRRDRHVRIEDIGKTWRALGVVMNPWWADLFRIFLLTGLRDSLVTEMRFDEIDFERGLYLIPPLKPGTKRRRSGLSMADRKKPIELPLSKLALQILAARKEFAPDTPAGEWVWYSPETERRKKTDLPRLSDPRSAWKRLTPILGYWVYKHDLRRTFASLAFSIDSSNPMLLSKLLLHSNVSTSQAIGVPQITLDYIHGQEHKMRDMAEKVAQAILELAGLTEQTALTAHIGSEYAVLPDTMTSALAKEAKGFEG